MKINFCDATYEVDSSWDSFFTTEKLILLKYIEFAVGTNFTPPAERVLRFTQVNLDKVRVVIIGQDPYPQPGVATGRSFEVGNIDHWADLKRNASLMNMLKLFHKNYTGASEIGAISKVREDIDAGLFPILPPTELFTHFEEQGVLMLNAAFTCEIDNSGSHTEKWQHFSTELLTFISDKKPQAKWFLWGKDAQEFCSFVPDSQKLTSYHPRLFDQKEGSFIKENHFAKCPEINWVE
ncbi:uracil-DNA glycosylase [Maridesulfovibrio ferrireducens]|uniref:uracil-DNA glycosylase n=1 Tax=Maridesulfovibrio ferrireducens TaxID=246191 RepID=UPI001A2F29CE|nr:uracil-DNA glycosylase [Maridesulfovibrio ferrireducens]MBI9109782.1 uracil-DNA glycosylase [Maridesulfovibrio ferrireducens]